MIKDHYVSYKKKNKNQVEVQKSTYKKKKHNKWRQKFVIISDRDILGKWVHIVVVNDVRFLHVIKLFTRKYNRIVSAGSCVFHKCFHNIHHVKCLGINCLFV